MTGRARTQRRALVVVARGPDDERGALGLRTALALGSAGLDVTVWLCGPGALFARDVDAAAWLGGDPRADVDSLLDDLEAAVMVDARATVDGEGAAMRVRRPEIAVAGGDAYRAAVRAADLVMAF